MENMNSLERILEALNDLRDGQDPVQNKPLSRPSAAREGLIRNCLYRTSCFLRQIIARNTPVDLPPFFLTAEQQRKLTPAETPVRQAELLRQINRAAEGNACRPLTGAELTSWLVERELYLPFPEDNDIYILAPEGEAVGLHYDQTHEFPVLYYDPSAQRFLFDHLEDLLRHIQSRAARLPTLSVHPKFLPAAIQDMERLSKGCHPETGEALSPEDPLCQEALRAGFAQAAEALCCGMEAGLFPVRPEHRGQRL